MGLTRKIELDDGTIKYEGDTWPRPEFFMKLDTKGFEKATYSLLNASKMLVEDSLDPEIINKELYLKGLSISLQIFEGYLDSEIDEKYKEMLKFGEDFFKYGTRRLLDSKKKEYFNFLKNKALEVYSIVNTCDLESKLSSN